MHILVVEDNQVTLRLLEKKLKKWGHTLYLAEDGMEAWTKLKTVPAEIVVSDWMMPGMDGLELCRRIRNTDFKRYIYLILATAKDSQQDIVSGLEAGVDDYITKPVNFEELRARIEIGARIVRMERELTLRYDGIKKNYFQTIHMFTHLIEVFNEDLGGHCRRVAKLCLNLAKRYPDISEEDTSVVEAAGLLHDIGMVGFPKEIFLKKRTELNGDEIQLYRSHPVQGEIILKEIEFLEPIAKLVRHHHEQFNGRGFPDGLAGKEIPFLARIVSAASIYDNLVHRGKVPLKDLQDNLQRLRGYQLEPAIVDQLLEINLENIQEEKGRNFMEVDFDDLQEGMLLAKDIRRKNGSLVLPGHTQMTSHNIEKLKGYRRLACVDNKVYIYK